VKGVVLIGHGGVPRDYPREKLARLRRLEAERRARGGRMSAEEEMLDEHIRRWPRTPQTDPYQAGLEAVGRALAPLVGDARLVLAYNEFCAPGIAEAVDSLVRDGASEIVLATSMVTPGGSHAELEIPEEARRLQELHPGVRIRYAWPYDLEAVAQLVARQVR
jgi:sirohydrochlorin cobaltochelatase